MCFQLINNIRPSTINAVACSGGIDSMVLVDFLLSGKNKPDILFFHHNTKTSEDAYHFLKDYCARHDLNFISERLAIEIPKGRSKEDFWREQRYLFLKGYKGFVATAHHLDDAIETWLFTCFHGQGKLIPSRNENIVRPFLLVEKKEIIEFAKRHHVEYIDDVTNLDVNYARNRIRHLILPEVKAINKGIAKVIKKKYLNTFCQDDLIMDLDAV